MQAEGNYWSDALATRQWSLKGIYRSGAAGSKLYSPQDGGHLSARGGAQQRGKGHAHERQHALQLLDNAREELIGCDTEDGGHEHDLECAQRQPL